MVAEADFIFEQEIKDNTCASKKAPVIFGELKNELGKNGQCGPQNALTLRKHLAAKKDSIMEFSMQPAAPASQFQLQDPISLSAEPFLQIYSLLRLSRILSTWEVNPSATNVSSLYLGYLVLSLRATYGDKDVPVKFCFSFVT
ncbi:hypothetical protein AX14_002675 [Amanita brunnescens Koide BX004]|nr:hypothetical protein AX14_002675 [Amanita brunnescens Koide BX004]